MKAGTTTCARGFALFFLCYFFLIPTRQISSELCSLICTVSLYSEEEVQLPSGIYRHIFEELYLYA